jgi:hypothetical protein
METEKIKTKADDPNHELDRLNQKMFSRIKRAADQAFIRNDFWKMVCPGCGYMTPLFGLHIETCAICDLELGCND